MSLPLKSQKDLYDLFILTLQNKSPELTDVLDGSVIDGLAGVFSVAGMELQRYNLLLFNKTFIDLANGPEITGGPDDLQTLVVDHFGALFARPAAVSAIDTVTFSRPTNTAGACAIPIGTIVKTAPDANGDVQRYSTNAAVALTSGGGTDLSVSVAVTAVVAGAAGNATAGTINTIESTLLDPSVVCSNTGNATGEDAQSDSEYRETIRNLIIALRAATRSAIESTALAVSGVVVANAIELEKNVIFWDPSISQPIGQYFQIPFVTLYIADNTGGASGALIAEVKAAIDPIRAFGVHIDVSGASAVVVDWSLQIVLNPAGPNYATLLASTAEIVQTMTAYIATLATGSSFVRATAEAAIMAVWGPAGSNDLVSVHTTVPTGDVSITGSQKAVPGTIQTV